MEKLIVVEWFPVSKAEKIFSYKYEMIVILSSHTRFIKGSRFDFALLTLANKQGYTVEIRPGSLERKEKE